MITRFAVLPDERRLLLGIDKNNLFKEGRVYEVREILGEIIFKDIGEVALPEKGPTFPNMCSDVNSQVQYGLHLVTKEEYNKIKNELSNS